MQRVVSWHAGKYHVIASMSRPVLGFHRGFEIDLIAGQERMIDDIRQKFQLREYEYSLHAVDQSILKRITRREVEEAVANGEIIEDYPTDKYGPSCLIFGTTTAARPLHVQCTYPTRQKVKIITVYEPDPNEWVNFKTRRTK